MTEEFLDQAGALTDSFDKTVLARYVYPGSMLVQTRAVPKGDDRDFSRSVQFNKDASIDDLGQWTETMTVGGASRDLGHGHVLRDLVKSEAVNAPVLLGLWLNGRQEGAYSAEEVPGGSVRFVIPELNLRATLVEAADPDGGWIEKLEVVDPNGSPLVWWEYDLPVTIEGSLIRTGSVRTRFSVHRSGRIHESVPSELTTARVLPTGLISVDEARLATTGPRAPSATEGSAPIPVFERRILSVFIGVGVVVLVGVSLVMLAKRAS